MGAEHPAAAERIKDANTIDDISFFMFKSRNSVIVYFSVGSREKGFTLGSKGSLK